jgi:hypothetical protein
MWPVRAAKTTAAVPIADDAARIVSQRVVQERCSRAALAARSGCHGGWTNVGSIADRAERFQAHVAARTAHSSFRSSRMAPTRRTRAASFAAGQPSAGRSPCRHRTAGANRARLVARTEALDQSRSSGPRIWAVWRRTSVPGRWSLTPDDFREIDEAASRIEVQGARYAEAARRTAGWRVFVPNTPKVTLRKSSVFNRL